MSEYFTCHLCSYRTISEYQLIKHMQEKHEDSKTVWIRIGTGPKSMMAPLSMEMALAKWKGHEDEG